jgi:mannosyltransferase OCH1-like enzyme
MQKIPKIIHQIWGGTRPVPGYFKTFSQTWLNCHPDWKYEFWDNDRINKYVQQYYPLYWDTFIGFEHNIQRWDSVRYLILDKIGGLYADCDTECLKPIDKLIEGMSCWFALEPDEHAKLFNKTTYISNAIMGAIPGHSFIKRIIQKVFSNIKKNEAISSENGGNEVLLSTGPLMITTLYESLTKEEKENVHIIPSCFLSPFSHRDTMSILIEGSESNELEQKLEHAYAVHYFFYEWLKGDGLKK